MSVSWQHFLQGFTIGWVLGVSFCTLLIWLSKKKIQRDTKKAIKEAAWQWKQFREKVEAYEKELAGVTKNTEKFRHKADWN